MLSQLLFTWNPWILPAGFVVVLMLAIDLPARFGRKLVSRDHLDDNTWNVVQGGIVALVAFMLGISFSQSEGRFDARRGLVVTEANAIGTTWLRADQLPGVQAARFRALLTDYTATRLHAYESQLSPDDLQEAQSRSDAEQAQLWSLASGALRASPHDLGRSLLVASLNDTIDVSAEQLAALTHHVPTTIVFLTLVLVIIGAALIGFSFARAGESPQVLALAYVLVCVLVVEMIVDLDRPQSGFVRVNLDPIKIQLSSMR